MKKLMNIFVLVAAAAMTLASCQKNEIDGPVKQEVHFTINAGIAETKTIITDNGDGTYTPSWRKEDKIGIFFTEPTEKVSKVEAEFSNTKEDGETASFEGTASVEGEGTFYAFYPSSAFNQHYGDGTIRLDLPASQKPTSTSFDPACDILVARPCDYIADGETVVIDNLYFARLMSVLRVNLVGDYAKDQIVESFSVEVDVNANVDITGNAKVDYKNATISAWNNGNVNRNVVTATYTNEEYITIAGTNNAAYLVVAPVTIPSGTTLTFTIETENYDIVKTVTAPADMVMPAGNIAVINLTIAEENCTAKTEDTSDYSGEWLIAGKEGETWYAAQKYVSGNYLSVTALEFEGESILESDGLSDCYMHIEKVVGGDYDGMYTIMDAGGKYLSTSSSTSNNMKAVTDLDANSYWDIEANDDGETYSLIATKSSYTRNDMRFNYNSGTNSRVSCYDGSKTAQPYLKLFSESLVKADTTPRITVEDTEYNVSADDETLEFSYTTKNIDGTPTVSVADGATMTNVQADAEAGIVTVKFVANAEEVEKTATLVLSYAGAESVSVTITQAAKAAEGGESGWISTPFADLKEGDQVVIVSTKNTSTWAMSNDKGTSAPTGVTGVTYANGKLTVEPTENIIWYVGVDGNNRIFYKDSGKATWLYCTGTNNGVKVGTNEAKTFTLEDGYLKHIGTGRYVGVYTTNPDWRCYTSINTNIQGQTFQFFVKAGEGSGETPVEKTLESIAVSGAETEYTVGDEFVKPTVTATYSDGSTEDVTASAEFTGYNMSAADTYTVTVSYSGKTTTYSITVSAAQGGGDVGGTSYSLLWSDTETTSGYTTSESSITASDGSVWAIKGYLRNSTNQFIQLGKGGANYITTPVASAPITKITVTCGSSYYLTVCTTDGTELMNKQPGGGNADYDNVVEFDLSSYSYTQVKLISRRSSGTSNAAVYIQSVVVE